MPAHCSPVTATAVFEAASAIAAEGRRPTNAAIRARLGGGSYSTIAPLLRRWHLSQAVGWADELPSAAWARGVGESPTLAAMQWLRSEVVSLQRQLAQAEARIQRLAAASSPAPMRPSRATSAHATS